MTALKGDTAFQARSLVRTPFPNLPIVLHTSGAVSLPLSLCANPLPHSHQEAHPSTVPLPPPPILAIRSLQLPRIRPAAHQRRLPRQRRPPARRAANAGAHPARVEGAADDEAADGRQSVLPAGSACGGGGKEWEAEWGGGGDCEAD